MGGFWCLATNWSSAFAGPPTASAVPEFGSPPTPLQSCALCFCQCWLAFRVPDALHRHEFIVSANLAETCILNKFALFLIPGAGRTRHAIQCTRLGSSLQITVDNTLYLKPCNNSSAPATPGTSPVISADHCRCPPQLAPPKKTTNNITAPFPFSSLPPSRCFFFFDALHHRIAHADLVSALLSLHQSNTPPTCLPAAHSTFPLAIFFFFLCDASCDISAPRFTVLLCGSLAQYAILFGVLYTPKQKGRAILIQSLENSKKSIHLQRLTTFTIRTLFLSDFDTPVF